MGVGARVRVRVRVRAEVRVRDRVRVRVGCRAPQARRRGASAERAAWTDASSPSPIMAWLG